MRRRLLTDSFQFELLNKRNELPLIYETLFIIIIITEMGGCVYQFRSLHRVVPIYGLHSRLSVNLLSGLSIPRKRNQIKKFKFKQTIKNSSQTQGLIGVSIYMYLKESSI